MVEQVQHCTSAITWQCRGLCVNWFSILFQPAVTWQCIDLCAVCVNRFSILFQPAVTCVPSMWTGSAFCFHQQWLGCWACGQVQHLVSASSNFTMHWLVCCMCEQVQCCLSNYWRVQRLLGSVNMFKCCISAVTWQHVQSICAVYEHISMHWQLADTMMVPKVTCMPSDWTLSATVMYFKIQLVVWQKMICVSKYVWQFQCHISAPYGNS